MITEGGVPVFGGNGINGYHNQSNVDGETLVIGRVGYYCGSIHLTPDRAWVTDNALIVRHDESKTYKKYLFYALQAVDLRVNDSSTAQPVISGQKIYSLLISIPTISEQYEIVRRVEALFVVADNLEARYNTVRSQVDQLTPSLLAKAFRGELVHQDPNDDPAEKLLEQIQRQRVQSTKRKVVKTKKSQSANKSLHERIFEQFALKEFDASLLSNLEGYDAQKDNENLYNLLDSGVLVMILKDGVEGYNIRCVSKPSEVKP